MEALLRTRTRANVLIKNDMQKLSKDMDKNLMGAIMKILIPIFCLVGCVTSRTENVKEHITRIGINTCSEFSGDSTSFKTVRLDIDKEEYTLECKAKLGGKK